LLTNKITDTAKNLGIKANNLRRWMTEFKQEESGEHLNKDEQEELRHLRKENRGLKPV